MWIVIATVIYVIIGALCVLSDIVQPVINQPNYVRRGDLSIVYVLFVILLWPLRILSMPQHTNKEENKMENKHEPVEPWPSIPSGYNPNEDKCGWHFAQGYKEHIKKCRETEKAQNIAERHNKNGVTLTDPRTGEDLLAGLTDEQREKYRQFKIKTSGTRQNEQ